MSTSTGRAEPNTQLVSAVVLAYGPAPGLRRCVECLRASRGVELEIVVVDNGCEPAVLESVRDLPGVAVVGDPVNRGFAGGCNFGIAHARGDVVVLVNDDAFPQPDALLRLCRALEASDVGIASASLRLEAEPSLINSAGNPLHYTGVSWAGGFGEPASAHCLPRDVAAATGAAMAISRALWERLQGFDEAYFAYMEDTELSLRTWQLGKRVLYVPDAVVLHDYEFSRSRDKLFLLERNRLLLLATCLEVRTLLLIAPALLAVELAVLVQSVADGWARQKLASYLWLLRHRAHVRARRRFVQRTRVRPDRALCWLLSSKIEPANVALPPLSRVLNWFLSGYWSLLRIAALRDRSFESDPANRQVSATT